MTHIKLLFQVEIVKLWLEFQEILWNCKILGIWTILLVQVTLKKYYSQKHLTSFENNQNTQSLNMIFFTHTVFIGILIIYLAQPYHPPPLFPKSHTINFKLSKISTGKLCSFREYPYPLQRMNWNFLVVAAGFCTATNLLRNVRSLIGIFRVVVGS